MADDIPSPGKLVLRRFDGETVYPLEAAELQVRSYRDVTELHFLVRAAEGEDGAGPSASVSVLLEQFELGSLAGSRFSVPAAYDESHRHPLSNFDHLERQPLLNNEIEVQGIRGGVVHVRWTASTIDADDSDGSKRDVGVEIEADFRLHDVEAVDRTLQDVNRNPPHRMVTVGLFTGAVAGALLMWNTNWLPVWMGAVLGALVGFMVAGKWSVGTSSSSAGTWR